MGNTTITGFANISSTLAVAGITTFSGNVVLGSVGLSANGGFGTAGQVLHSNGTAAYWAADDNAGGTVTSIATANGLSGGTITTSGTLGVTTGSTLTVNTTGIHVNSALSITSLALAGAASGITTLAAGNTSITGSISYSGSLTTTNTALFTAATGSTIFGVGTSIVSANTQAGRTYEGSHDFNSYPNLYSSIFINPSTATNMPAGMSGNPYRFIMGAGDTGQRGFDLVGSGAQLWWRARENGNNAWYQAFTTAGGTITGVTTFSANVVLGSAGLSANGGFGTAGQVLHSNGTAAYWAADDGGTTTNAVTFNNGGSGAASGTTFDGSAARTISYNTVGAPSTTGTNASGNWGINVTGTAASTPNPTFSADAVTKNDITTRTETGFYETSTGTLAEGWPTDSNGWHHLISSTHSNDSNYYALQIASRFDTQNLYFRNTNGSGTTAWSTLLHSGNYNTFAPTLTGTGASGTWGINITGSAATATDSTKLPTAGGTMTGLIVGRTSASTDVNVANDTGSFSAMGNTTTIASMSFHRSAAFAINVGLGTDNVFRIGGWSASNNCLQINGSGTVTALADFRAPIFYDSNNTAYYADPNSASRLSSILVGGGEALLYENSTHYLTVRTGATPNYKYFRFDTNGYLYGQSGGFIAEAGDMRAPIFYDQNDTTVRWDGGTFVLRSASPTVYFRDTDHNSAMIHVNSNIFYVLRGGNDTETWTTVGSGSWPLEINLTNNNAQFGGIVTAITDMRSPIFYDSNNTAYYTNPASTSVLSSLALGGATSTPQGALWISGEIWISGNGNRVAFTTDGSTDSTPNASVRGSTNDLIVQNWSGSVSQDNFYVFGASRDAAAAGNITAYYSDERLKTKTGLIDNALDKVLSLEGFTYIENELARSVGYNNQKQQVGLSAQKVKAVLPEAVALAPFDYDPQDDGTIISKSGEDYLTVDYSRLVPLLIEAIKEQQAHINRLEQKINLLGV